MGQRHGPCLARYPPGGRETHVHMCNTRHEQQTSEAPTLLQGLAGWGRGCDRDRPGGMTAYNLDVSSGTHQSHQGFATGEKLGHHGEGGHRHGGGAWSTAQTPSTVGRARAVEDGSACGSGSGSRASGSELPSGSSALFSTLLRPWRLTSAHFPLASGLGGRAKGKRPWDM